MSSRKAWLAKVAGTVRRVIGRHARGAAIAAIALIAVSAGVGAYSITRLARDAEPVVRASGSLATATATPAAGAPTPRPVETVPPDQRPDTSVPGWGVPLKDEETAKPRYAQTINGIRLEPLERGSPDSVCQPGEAAFVAHAVGDASPLAVAAAALPATAVLDPSFSEDIGCGGRVVAVGRFYIIPTEPGAAERIASGVVSWYDVEHGGYVWISCMAVKQPVWGGSEVPSDQWSSATVAGLPAAVGKPFLPGFGYSSVVVWDSASGLLTAIRATDRSIEEVLAVAEGVVK